MGVGIAGSPAFPYPDLEAEEAEPFLASVDHMSLCLVQEKIHPPQKFLQNRHWSLGSPSAENDDIVRITDDACAKLPFQLPTLPYPIHKV